MKRFWAFLGKRPYEGPWFYLFSLPVLTGALVALGWPRLHDIRLRYEYRSLRTDQMHLMQENRELQLEWAKLRSFSRVEEIARGRLGMIDPAKGQLIWVQAPDLAKGR